MRSLATAGLLLFTATIAACSRPADPAPESALPETIAPTAPSAPASASAVASTTATATEAPAPPAPESSADAAGAAAKHALRWSKAIELKSLADLDAAMHAKLRPNKSELTLVAPNGGTDKRAVDDCELYSKAIGEGYTAESTFEITQESFFKQRCTPLRFLREARPSARSYVNELRLDRDPLEILPASMNLEMEGPSDAQKAEIARGASLKSYSPKLKVTKRSATSVTFLEPESKIESTVEIVARGDLDHDGIEDVLLFQSRRSLEGSFRGYEQVAATRRSASGALVVVRSFGR